MKTLKNYICVDSGTTTDADVADRLQELKILCKYKNLNPDKHVKFLEDSTGYSIQVSQKYQDTPTSEDCPL